MKSGIVISIIAIVMFILVISNIGYFSYEGSARIGSQSTVQYQQHVHDGVRSTRDVAVYNYIQ